MGHSFRLSCLTETVPQNERSKRAGLSTATVWRKARPSFLQRVSLNELHVHDGGGGLGTLDHVERNVGGHVAFFAQGLADGRERGDAARRNLVIVEADDRNVLRNG